MAVKKRRRKIEEETSEFKAAMLAPHEEQLEQHTTDLGALRINAENLPKNFIGAEDETARMFRPHGIVVAIIGLLLAFIAFVAYLIGLMPEPTR